MKTSCNEFMNRSEILGKRLVILGGGVLQISSYRDYRMGAKIKTPKNPWTKISLQNNPILNFQATNISRGTTQPKSSGCFE